MTRLRFRPIASSLASLWCTAVAGCDVPGVDPADRADPAIFAGEARLVLNDVPADVRCVRVTAAGPGRTSVTELAADAAMMQTTLTGLPVGSVGFTGEAFAAECSSVSSRTPPVWVSDPETATIAPGRLATVTLVMRLNGRAKVSVRFDDERCAGDAGCGDARAP